MLVSALIKIIDNGVQKYTSGKFVFINSEAQIQQLIHTN